MNSKTTFNLRYKLIFILMLLTLISACAPPRKAKVVERKTITERIETERIGGRLIRHVQSGDTLHSIAFAHNLNPSDVAAWNNLSDVRKLQVGQRIRLTEPIGFVKKEKQVVVTSIPVTRGSESSESSDSNSTQASQKTITVNPEVNKSDTLSWSWPTKGNVIANFALSRGQQGIDIQAPQGQAVRASSSGVVVYVGNGLKGYGNLVILKHNDRFLSAYAHNQEILVLEGDRVRAQQIIGSVGLNKRGIAALQFQIRENGKPVNPLNYLKG